MAAPLIIDENVSVDRLKEILGYRRGWKFQITLAVSSDTDQVLCVGVAEFFKISEYWFEYRISIDQDNKIIRADKFGDIHVWKYQEHADKGGIN